MKIHLARFSISLLLLLVSIVGLSSMGLSSAHADAVAVQNVAQQLVGAKLSQVTKTVVVLEEFIGSEGDEKVLPLFKALMAGELYYQRENERLVIVSVLEDKSFDIAGVFDDAPVQNVQKKTLRKVKTNNRLRSNLRKIISRATLFSKNAEQRKDAVASLIKNLSEENVALLATAQKTETNKKVLANINTALALSQLSNSEPQARLLAVNALSGDLDPIVHNALTTLLEKNEDGTHKESSSAVVNAATQAIAEIDSSVTFYGYLETIFFGLSLGSVLLLIAAGLAITFGVMGVINMAHGEMIMIGAYTTYVIQLLLPNNLALALFLSIPAAFLVSACVGVIIERGVIQFLKGRPLETLLATFGISLILQQLVRSIFSPLNRQVSSPEFMSGALELNPIFSITYNRLYILIFALIVFAALQLILRKTSLGLNVRAVSQNRDMAKCMGIKTEWVDAMTFGLGSGIAGLAGVALSQITNVGPNLGQAYIIDSFMVVVFGGVGNLWGTLVGGFTLGVLNKFLEPATGAVLANIIVLVGIILFIQKRPKGLFPQKGRAAE